MAINEAVFKRFPIISSPRLNFRQFREADAKGMFRLKTDNSVMEFMDSPIPSEEKEVQQSIQNIIDDFKSSNGINWIIEDKFSGSFMGYFGFWRLDKKNSRGEIGYSLLPEYWGKGYMSETFETLLPFAFQKMNLHSIEANINLENRRSENLLKKYGFKKEAHFRENYFYNGQYLDSIIYCLLEKDLSE